MVSVGAVRKLLKEIEASGAGEHVLALGGTIELAAVLRRQLLRGGADPAALRLGGPEGADAYVHVLGADDDEDALRRANRARVPAIVIATGPVDGVPYVLATSVIGVEEGQAFPLAEIARVIARRLGEDGAPLAARVPILRDAVCARLIATAARKNGLFAAAIWLRAGSADGEAADARPKSKAARGGRAGADLPVLALNQLRLVLRIAQAHGETVGRDRLPELLATLGAGFGLRALAQEALDAIPVAGWVVKGAVAYAGTRAVGEAAKKRFALAASAPAPARLTRPRAAAVPVAP